MARYAADTSVSVAKSRADIEETLQRYGADQFMSGWDQERAVIRFRAHERLVQFVLPLPDRDDPEFWETPTGRARAEDQAFKAWEQACRQRWRALLLSIKAKLEAVESGIEEFEEAFLAQIVLADGSTVGEMVRPKVAEVYETGRMPSELLALPAGPS